MNDPRTIERNRCVTCGGRLRNAVFCSACGHSSCSYACHLRHLAQHGTMDAQPSQPDAAWHNEQPEASGGKAVAL